jgi:beta-glucosidase
VYETAEQRGLALEIARKSMVLLKNDGLLPLKKTIGTLAVIGPNADEGRNQLGDYSYAAVVDRMQISPPENSSFSVFDPVELGEKSLKVITVLDGIRAVVSPTTKILYVKGCDILGDSREGFNDAIKAAEQADVVVLVLGDRSGLDPSCTTGETRDSVDLRLSGLQEELARTIINTGKPIIAVLVNGRPFAIPWLDENVNSMLEAWLPGEEGGAAIADILFGDVNPGGKLPITFPRHVGQLPIFYNSKPSGMHSHWYGDYVTEKVTPLYPFGHGLSFTIFEYADLSINRAQVTEGEIIEISFKLMNSGSVAGDEVAQLYIHDEFATSPRPVKELKGYVRQSLQPGEACKVTFHLSVDQLAFYDEDLNLVVEPGKIEVMVGSSSEDIRLQGDFEIIGAKIIPVKQRVFDCRVDVK